MLDLLVRYGADRGLVSEPGFAAKAVRWLIAFDGGGRFLDVLPLGDPDQKRNVGRVFTRCPEFSQPEMKALHGTGSHFLLDACSVVSLYGVKEGDAKAEGKHEYFVGMLRSAAEVVPGMDSVAATLSEPEPLAAIQIRLKELRALGTDKATVMVDGAIPLEGEVWHDWWRAHRATVRPSRGSVPGMVCLASGEVGEPAKTHPKIRGLGDVGGMAFGTTLIGYDKPSYGSYGLEQSANGAVIEEVAFAYRDSLEHLLEHHSSKLAGMRVAHWFSHEIPSEDDPFAMLTDPPSQVEASAQQAAAGLLDSVRTGRRSDLAQNHFYAIALSGSDGRVMTRDWMEGQFEELAANVAAWFRDLEVVSIDPKYPVRTPGIERVITCLLPPRKPKQDYDDWAKPISGHRQPLWSAAVRNTPIPFSAVARIMAVHRPFVQTSALEKSEPDRKSLHGTILHNRMALLKAYHVRSTKGDCALEPYLNEEHPSAAYQCGRLMAVLAQLQRRAMPDVQAGVVQRFYAAASATPALVLGRLCRTSQFHLNKLDPGLARWHEKRIAGVWSHIHDRVPATLTLEEQSLFALGYYQQLAADARD